MNSEALTVWAATAKAGDTTTSSESMLDTELVLIMAEHRYNLSIKGAGLIHITIR